MGLALVRMVGLSVVAVEMIALTSCTLKSVNPAERVKGRTFYYDCCSPSLQPADKELCKMAQDDEDHILHDDEGNKYVYIWSDCKPGEEPWRKYE